MTEFLEIEDLWTLQNETHIQVTSEIMDKMLEGKEGQVYWATEMSVWYESLLLQAKEAYYVGKPIMSDKAFDKLEDLLRYIKPYSEALKKVG